MSKEDTPHGQCKAFWLSATSESGIRPVDLKQTPVERCVLQRGYGTVVLQLHASLATNDRLRNSMSVIGVAVHRCVNAW
jgi:hypothetical protein